jgi:hypothetical protein
MQQQFCRHLNEIQRVAQIVRDDAEHILARASKDFSVMSFLALCVVAPRPMQRGR